MILETPILLNYSARPFILMCQSLLYHYVVTLTEKLLSVLIIMRVFWYYVKSYFQGSYALYSASGFAIHCMYDLKEGIFFSTAAIKY